MNRVEIKLLERTKVSRRRALNSPLKQGTEETVQYFADFAPWGANVSFAVISPVVTVLNQDDIDVTEGAYDVWQAASTSVVNTEIQFTLENFIAGDRYRVFIKCTIRGHVQECWTYIDGEL